MCTCLYMDTCNTLCVSLHNHIHYYVTPIHCYITRYILYAVYATASLLLNTLPHFALILRPRILLVHLCVHLFTVVVSCVVSSHCTYKYLSLYAYDILLHYLLHSTSCVMSCLYAEVPMPSRVTHTTLLVPWCGVLVCVHTSSSLSCYTYAMH